MCLFQGGINKDMGKFHVLFLFFVAIMFGISLISLFGYHCYLTSRNRSTLGKFQDMCTHPQTFILRSGNSMTSELIIKHIIYK